MADFGSVVEPAPRTPSSLSLLAPSPPLAGPSEDQFDTLRVVSRHVFRQTNDTRRKRDLSTLKRDDRLAAVACAHNGDMFRRDFFAHKNPDGALPQDRVAQMHRRLVGAVSENLYRQVYIKRDPKALANLMVEKWLKSPEHRKNLLDPKRTHLGVCVLQRQDTLFATQVFAKIGAYLSSPLPRTVEPGTRLPLSIERTVPPTASVGQYDFLDLRTASRITSPTVLTDSLHVPDTTGTFRSRFYILERGQYVIHHGPDITVRAPHQSN